MTTTQQPVSGTKIQQPTPLPAPNKVTQDPLAKPLEKITGGFNVEPVATTPKPQTAGITTAPLKTKSIGGAVPGTPDSSAGNVPGTPQTPKASSLSSDESLKEDKKTELETAFKYGMAMRIAEAGITPETFEKLYMQKAAAGIAALLAGIPLTAGAISGWTTAGSQVVSDKDIEALNNKLLIEEYRTALDKFYQSKKLKKAKEKPIKKLEAKV